MGQFRRINRWYGSLPLLKQGLTYLVVWLGARLLVDLSLTPFVGWRMDLLEVLRWLSLGLLTFLVTRWWTRRFVSVLSAPDKKDG